MADAIAARAGVPSGAYTPVLNLLPSRSKSASKPKRFIPVWLRRKLRFLKGTFVRDKDAIIASMLVCEAACWYAGKGMTLLDAMDALYEKYGYYSDLVISKTLKGMEGIQKITDAVETLRKNPVSEIGGIKVAALRDYGNPYPEVLKR